MSDPQPPGQPPDPVWPTQPVWPAEPPLAPAPPVVPAPWSDRMPHDPGPPAPPPKNRTPILVVLAVLAVIAVAVATFLVLTDDDETTSAGVPTTAAPTTLPGATSTTGTTPTTAPTNEFDQVIADITAFVEQERGLRFQQPVTVTLASDEDFADRLLRDFEEDRADLEETDALYTALGLIEADVDLVEALRALLEGAVVGLYDPETNELLVRGGSTTPYTRQTIAHELTHALDDQHFELDRPDLRDADDETGFGFLALAEGDAERIGNAYLESLSAAEQAEAFDEQFEIASGIDIFSIPPILLETLAAPYEYGPDLVEAILLDGRQALDDTFDDPPTTSEQFLDLEAFFEQDERKDVPVPEADGEQFDEGAIGAFGLAQMLDSVGSNATDEAVDGWGGDWYVAWEDGDRTCVRAVFVGDTPEDSIEIYDALRDWSESQSDALVEFDSDLTLLTACG